MPNSSLLQWLATFQLDGKTAVELDNDAYYNLADGYVCARILNQISPKYFPETWLDGIRPVPPNGSWRLRVSNLKRILQKIHDYSSDLQSPQFQTNSIFPDVGVIAQNFDPDQIGKLIQLILFCAINSEQRDSYIEQIRNLPTRIKQDIKEAIEELLIRNPKGQPDLDTSSNSNSSHHNKSNIIDYKSPKKTQTQADVASSASADSQNYDVIRRDSGGRIDQTDSIVDEPDQIGKIGYESRRKSTNDSSVDRERDSLIKSLLQQSKKYQEEANKLKEELINIETEKEDYRLKSELLRDDLDRITNKHDELREKAKLSQRLQDELDELKHSSDKLGKYELATQGLERQNADLKKDLKLLEDNSISQAAKIIGLEEEISQLANSLSRVDIYKKKLQEIQVKLSQETHRAERAELELVRLTDKYTAAKKENEKLYETTNHLMTLNGGSSSDNSVALINRIEELQRSLFQKEQALIDSDAKYQKSLKKAKALWQHISVNQIPGGASFNQSCLSSCNSIDETATLKQQLKDREDRLISLERELYETKKVNEIHERLMMTAFYGLVSVPLSAIQPSEQATEFPDILHPNCISRPFQGSGRIQSRVWMVTRQLLTIPLVLIQKASLSIVTNSRKRGYRHKQ